MYTNNRVQILHLCYIYIPWINQGDGLIYHHNNNFNQFEKKICTQNATITFPTKPIYIFEQNLLYVLI